MRTTRQAILRPFKIVRKKARALKNENPTGRHIAKLCARYRRRSGNAVRRMADKLAPRYSAQQIQQMQSNSGGESAVDSAALKIVGNSSTEADAQSIAANDSMAGSASSDATRVLNSIKHFANPGEGFEKPSEIDSRNLSTRARTIAFYLPQFHAFDENDEWWGKGFSEWRNVARGAPRFEGHYQPRIPRDLGFYDLNSPETIRSQAEMAARFGIDAFCFYYYWFNGKRLMDKPLDMFVADDSIDQEFCIMWANENWTRTWDGHDQQVLIQQDYRDADEEAFIADTAQYMSHPRYVHVDGKPLFILYRPGLLPDPVETLRRWRELWTEALGVTPLVIMVQGFDDEDPRKFQLDGAVEFPPHKLAADVPDMNHEVDLFDPEFAGHVRSYEAIVQQSLNEPQSPFPLIKTVSPHWDNDARREGRGMVLHGSTPALYEQWLNGVVDYACDQPFHGEPVVFVNAWNEWAESAYLEPDVHYGHAYLNATQRAVHGLSDLFEKADTSADKSLSTSDKNKQVLLVGHDAHQHGAQMLLLSLAKVFSQQFGMAVTLLIKNGGSLIKQYEGVAPTYVLSDIGEDALHDWLIERSFSIAICNTCVTGNLVPVLKDADIDVISLIHEMPMLINEYSLEKNVELIDRYADHVVFPSDIVRQGFAGYSRIEAGKQHIKPQGTYKEIVFDESARTKIRTELGIAEHEKMVLNVGYADLRKGFDIFLQTAQHWMRTRDDVHFVWAGAISLDMRRWIQSDLKHSEFSKRIHLVGFTGEMSDYYSACDALFLTSREDPYPTVVLEAMNVGVPTVLFKGATGFDTVMKDHGFAVERGNDVAVEVALSKALDEDTAELRQSRIDFVLNNCQLDDYCFELLNLLRPELRKLSVVVPNYNYEQYLPERLATVFDQDMPVFEVVVLDDKSTDNSLEIIRHCARLAGRKIKIVANETNSGNVFSQWKFGLSICRGSHIWIAEADDGAKPEFLSRSLASYKKGTRLSFTNSAQIDQGGKLLADSYDYYYNTVSPKLFESSFIMDGQDFIQEALAVRNVILNVSSVVWDRQHLVNTLASVSDELTSFSLVGDWCLYMACLDSADCRVSYIAESLNIHRRHASSVTHSLDNQRHLDEILTMHARARSIGRDHYPLHKQQAEYEAELRQHFRLLPASAA